MVVVVVSVLHILRLYHADVVLRAVGAIEADRFASRWIEAPEMEATTKDVAQGLLERLSELAIEVGIDDRIHRRVEVADPEQYVHHHLGRVAGVSADGAGDVPDEEGQPAQDEGAHDDAQRLGRLVLALHLRYRPLGGRRRARLGVVAM